MAVTAMGPASAVNAAIGLGLAASSRSAHRCGRRTCSPTTPGCRWAADGGRRGVRDVRAPVRVLSGSGRWPVFAALLCVDALIRLAAAVVATVAGWGCPRS